MFWWFVCQCPILLYILYYKTKAQLCGYVGVFEITLYNSMEQCLSGFVDVVKAFFGSFCLRSCYISTNTNDSQIWLANSFLVLRNIIKYENKST